MIIEQTIDEELEVWQELAQDLGFKAAIDYHKDQYINKPKNPFNPSSTLSDYWYIGHKLGLESA